MGQADGWGGHLQRDEGELIRRKMVVDKFTVGIWSDWIKSNGTAETAHSRNGCKCLHLLMRNGKLAQNKLRRRAHHRPSSSTANPRTPLVFRQLVQDLSQVSKTEFARRFSFSPKFEGVRDIVPGSYSLHRSAKHVR